MLQVAGNVDNGDEWIVLKYKKPVLARTLIICILPRDLWYKVEAVW
jgi:hypothetical protein